MTPSFAQFYPHQYQRLQALLQKQTLPPVICLYGVFPRLLQGLVFEIVGQILKISLDKKQPETFVHADYFYKHEETLDIATARELSHFLRFVSLGPCRVALVRFTSGFTPAAQNALLKILEEPPRNTYIFLIGSSIGGLLSTLRSRLFCVYFGLPKNWKADKPEEPNAQRIFELAGFMGKKQIFRHMAEFDKLEASQLDELLSQAMLQNFSLPLVKNLSKFLQARLMLQKILIKN